MNATELFDLGVSLSRAQAEAAGIRLPAPTPRRCVWCRGEMGLVPFSRDYCSRTCAEERHGREP